MTEQRKTTDLTSNFEEFESNDWRGNWSGQAGPQPTQEPPVLELPDEEMPRLDQNDCWLYEKYIINTLRRNLPDTMNKRVILMVRVLGARARIANRLENMFNFFIGRG